MRLRRPDGNQDQPQPVPGEAQRAGPRPQSRRLQALLSVLLLLMALLAYTFPRSLPQSPVLYGRLLRFAGSFKTAPPPPPRSPVKPILVPKPGTLLPMGGTGAAIRQAAPSGGDAYLLVFIGNCASCVGVDLNDWNTTAREHHLTMIMFTTAGKQEAAEYHRSLGVPAPLISDPRGEISRRLHAAFKPRAYLFDRDWKLRWAQPVPVQDNLMEDSGFKAAVKALR
ncbi:MAG TPA: hypothetical protein VFJ58_14030 [Armatimonadota bacterium]|nr:hypothetical protein [Armatimonadota bacterium]